MFSGNDEASLGKGLISNSNKMCLCLIMFVSSVADMIESVELVTNQYAESAKKSQTSTDADGQPGMCNTKWTRVSGAQLGQGKGFKVHNQKIFFHRRYFNFIFEAPIHSKCSLTRSNKWSQSKPNILLL